MKLIAMTFCTDIHGPLRMNPTDFSDSQTCHVVTPGQGFQLAYEISQHLLDGLALNVVQTFIVPRRFILMT